MWVRIPPSPSKMIDKTKLKEYLEFAREHYRRLVSFMDSEAQVRYATEHKGRIKMIKYLIFLIEQGEFNVKITNKPTAAV